MNERYLEHMFTPSIGEQARDIIIDALSAKIEEQNKEIALLKELLKRYL